MAIRISETMQPDPNEIEKQILHFKSDLKTMSPVDIVRRHIIHGECFILDDAAYFDLRVKVAAQYNLHPNDVLVVGSGKLGFSIAPKKEYRHFGNSSDVDVVVVSSILFDSLWKKVHYYSMHGGYWEHFQEFKDFLFHGWIRPDKFPPEKSFEEAMRWWAFFNELSKTGAYSSFKVRGAIYRDWHFLESYQLRSVTACKNQICEE
jgi:hypothetical protein